MGAHDLEQDRLPWWRRWWLAVGRPPARGAHERRTSERMWRWNTALMLVLVVGVSGPVGRSAGWTIGFGAAVLALLAGMGFSLLRAAGLAPRRLRMRRYRPMNPGQRR